MKRATVGLICAIYACCSNAACYSVLNGQQKLVYRSQETPVDLSLHIGDTVPVRFGQGATMLIDAIGTDCAPVNAGEHKTPVPFAWMDAPAHDPLTMANSWPATRGGIVAGGGRLGYPYIGPRGGHYRITSGGHRSYMPRR